MTTFELKKLEAALQARAKELARSLAQRNQITIERSADAFDATVLMSERESSAKVMDQEFRLLRQLEAARDRMRAAGKDCDQQADDASFRSAEQLKCLKSVHVRVDLTRPLPKPVPFRPIVRYD